MTRSDGTKTSSKRISSLSAAASTSLAQNGWTVSPGEPTGTRASAISGLPSAPGTVMLAVSRSIERARLHGFLEPPSR